MELRNGWNFHNDIAIPLETDARKVFSKTDRPITKIYDADAIECECFIEVMIGILRQVTDFEQNDEIDTFVKRCFTQYECAKMPEIAQTLYDDFSALLKKYA